MTEESKDTEHKILEAAKQVFIKKGMAGARMQEIADEAGINKALLHYYFRSKEKLFDAVFKDTVLKMVPKLTELFGSDLRLFDKIRMFFEYHISFLQSNPFLPGFILNELNQNPLMLLNTFSIQGARDSMVHFFKQVRGEVERGAIINIEPEQLLVNMVSLSVFPIVAKPIMQGVLTLDDTNYHQFINERKTGLAEFVINSIKVK